jgi:hypothetical protein
MTPMREEQPSPSRTARRATATALALSLCIAAGALGFRGNKEPAVSTRGDTTLTTITGGPFEPSGVAPVPGTNQMLFVDDGRPGEIMLLTLGTDGTQAGSVVPVPLGGDVTDPEGITSDGRHFYVVGSQSKKTGFDGDGLVRFTFDAGSRRVGGVERIAGLKAWLADNVPELAGTAKRIGDDVLNIEGLAWDPRKQRLLLGLRAPQVGGDALILPVRLADATGTFSRSNLRFDGPAIRLPLGGGGIRSLEYDATRQVFNVIAGAGADEESRDFQVFEWSGDTGAPLRRITTFSRDLKPEGFARSVIGGRTASVIVFDVGKFSVIY